MTRILPVIGALAVAAYAAVAVLSITVWDPLAAMPGRTHAEIVAGIEGAGESWTTGVVVQLVLFPPGVAGAVVLAALALARRMRWTTTVAWQLALLVCGEPLTFWAGFPLGMAVADAFFVGGGAHQPAPLVLYAVSALAAVMLAVAGIVAARWRAAPETAAGVREPLT